MFTSGHALRPLTGVVFVVLAAAGCRDAVTPPRAERGFSPALSREAVSASGRHVFVLSRNIPSDFEARVAALGGSIVSSMTDIGVVLTEGLSDADAAALAGRDAVTSDYVARGVPTPDEMQLSAANLEAAMEASSPRIPTFLRFQWNMDQIRAPQAWAAGFTGSPDVRVAILDSGLDPDHPDQKGLIDTESSIAFVPSGTRSPAWVDDYWHGTFVGSLVTSNNVRIAGVAPNVRLIAVKVADSTGSVDLGAVIAGIYHAGMVHAQVINLSLTISFPKDTAFLSANGTVHGGLLVAALNRAVSYAKRNGSLVVAAAGNEFVDLQHDGDFAILPCESGVALCVSATSNGDTHASYSNYGTNAVNVAAPGGDVPASPTTLILGACSTHATGPQAMALCPASLPYLFSAGTSFSAPQVSGLAAYLDSQFGGQLNPSQLAALIQQNADDIGESGSDPFFGKGRINVLNTLTNAHP